MQSRMIQFGIIALKIMSAMWLVDCFIDLHSLYTSYFLCTYSTKQSNELSHLITYFGNYTPTIKISQLDELIDAYSKSLFMISLTLETNV